jgi:tetratricopeptide (TPR) repeat protein
MSPEQAEGKRLDARSDIFSFGAVLYEMFTGRRAFQKDSMISTLAAILNQEPEPLGGEVPPDLEKIIGRCLRKDPERRFQTMADLRVALEELKEDSDSAKLAAAQVAARPRKNRFLYPALAAAAMFLLASGGSVLWQRMQAKPLTERDWIVLADFVNTTGDPVFDVALNQALSAQLNQSPYLNVVPEERVAETLKQMGRPPEERVTKRVAREICEREGVKALLTGSIAAVGSHYSIGLDATNCRTGDTLAQEQVESGNKDEVLRTLGQAASKMRRKLGESLASIQKLDTPIQQATTSSLEALKAFSLGAEQHHKGRFRAAIPFYRRAIELDPNFALAYRALSAVYANSRQPESAEQSMTKAFELRQRTTERERLFIEADYYQRVLGDMDRAVEAYKVLTQMYPREIPAFINWGLACNTLGQYEQAVELFREAMRLSGGANANPYSNLAASYRVLNRFTEAQALTEQWVKKFDAPESHIGLYRLAWIAGDTAGMQRQVDWFSGKPEELTIVALQAKVAASGGQFRKSRELWRRAVQMAKRAGVRQQQANFLSQEASQEALAGHFPEAREMAAESIELERNRGNIVLAALTLAEAGSAGPAQTLLQELTKRYPQSTLDKNVFVPSVQAVTEISRGDWRRAVELLESATPYELAANQALYVRGQAYLRGGAGQEAAAAFRKILDHRGVFLESLVYPLAHLGLGRAQALAGNTAEARKAYQDFLALWKDADPDVPILKEAKQEYAKLK